MCECRVPAVEHFLFRTNARTHARTHLNKVDELAREQSEGRAEQLFRTVIVDEHVDGPTVPSHLDA